MLEKPPKTRSQAFLGGIHLISQSVLSFSYLFFLGDGEVDSGICLGLGLVESGNSSRFQGPPLCIVVVAMIRRLKNMIHHWGLCASQRYWKTIRHASESDVKILLEL